MKKQLVILGATVLLLVALLLLLLLPDWDAPESPEGEPDAALPLYAATAPPVELRISNSVGAYTVLADRTGEEAVYSLAGFDPEIPLYQGMLSAMFTAAAALDADLLVVEAPSDLAPFGLDRPATVEIRFSDGTATTLLLGNETPEGGSLYLSARGDHLLGTESGVYAVRLSGVETFLQGALDLVHPTVTATRLERTLFTTATFAGTVREQAFTVTGTPPDTADSLSDYRLTDPVDWPVSRQGLSDLQSLFGLIAADVVAVNPEPETLAGYGLLEPFSTVTLTGTGEGAFTLHAGPVTGDGNVYLLREGVPVVYRLAAGQLPWLQSQYHDFMDRTALTAGIADVAAILVETEEAAYRFALSGEGESLSVTLDGEPLAMERFRPYYQTLVSARLDQYTDDRPPDGAAPLLTVTFTFRDAGADTLRFYTGIPLWRFVAAGELPPSFYTPSAYVDRVAEDAARLKRGETVTAY